MLRVARQPGELVGELDGPVVGALRRGAVTAEGECRDVLAAVSERLLEVETIDGEELDRLIAEASSAAAPSLELATA